MAAAIRFVRAWRRRLPGHIERGFAPGLMATLVALGKAVWHEEDSGAEPGTVPAATAAEPEPIKPTKRKPR